MIASQRIREVLKEYNTKGFTTTQPFSIGRNEARLKLFALNNHIALGSKSLYFTSKSIAHPNRKTKKNKGLAISNQDFEKFPTYRRKMDLFWDGDGFIYTDYSIKFIVKPNYEIKTAKKGKHTKEKKTCLITAGVVTDPNEFKRKEYQRVPKN